jgi:hypothetical protein
MTTTKNEPRSWFRLGLGSALPMIATLGFVLTSIYAKWNPIQAGETPVGEAQKTDAGAKGAKAKKAQKKKTEAVDRQANAAPLAVPGAGKKLDFRQLAKLIDQEVAKRMAEEGFKASPRSEDAEFLRRVYLDLIGVIPPADKVDAFLKDADPKKREKVVDELLANPRFGTALSEAWSGLMVPRESNNRRLNHTPLQEWLAKEFNADVPLDKLVFDLITATGTTQENGAATYFVGNPTVDKMTDNVTRMFLGVQLQCAQCHNHPFTDWKQTEYWAMAAFFMKTKLTVNPQQAAKKGVAPGITENAVKGGGKKKGGGLPDSAKIVPAKFLQGEAPKLNPAEPYRPVLAQWITSPTNPFFARAMVNRFWHQLFGRGLVNPVDDMHQDNPATHPELLAALTEQFKTSGFDTKYLIRAIVTSEAYQRSSRPSWADQVGDNKSDDRFFSHRALRVLSPEQMYDSLITVVGSPKKDGGAKKAPAFGGKKGPPPGGRDNFLNFFRIDEGADPLAYQVGIPQALRMMNSGQFNNTGDAVARAMKEGENVPSRVIERLYLYALSRRPAAEEIQRLLEFVRQNDGAEPRAAYGDILWAILNTSEFAFNH